MLSCQRAYHVQHFVMHCLLWVQLSCMLQAQHKRTRLPDNRWLCRPSQEVLDAVEGDFEGQEKVISLWSTPCLSQ